jgi:hypothetical protein
MDKIKIIQSLFKKIPKENVKILKYVKIFFVLAFIIFTSFVLGLLFLIVWLLGYAGEALQQVPDIKSIEIPHVSSILQPHTLFDHLNHYIQTARNFLNNFQF